MIVFLEAQGTNAYNRYAMFPAGQFRVKWFFFYLCSHIQISVLFHFIFIYLFIFTYLFIFLSSLLDYRFPYCIQLYTWSTQQVIVA